MSFTTGDVDIKIKDVRVTNERDVTPEFIVNEAADIYREMKKAKYKITDYEASDSFTARMRKEHPEFAQSYPIVLRYICQMQEFSKKAFTQYLSHIAKHPWKSHDEYLESQTDYVVMLYKCTHPRWNAKDVSTLRKNIHTMLSHEHKTFVDAAEKTQKEVEAEITEYKKKNREQLAQFYHINRDDNFDLTIRGITDISAADLPNLDDRLTVDGGSSVEITADSLLE